MKRLAAVLVLALLAPLTAEYLSGSLSFAQLGALPAMVAMYGGGAVLIRELARRTGRGWPTILLLGLAYGLVEEGIADQSLFNPHFMGLRLLDPGFIPSLGIGVPWTIYVLAIHVVWSIAVPIALAEALFPSLRKEPWLGRIGLVAAALLYAAGVAMVTMYFAKTFMASQAQLAASAAVIVAAIFLAFLLPRARQKMSGSAPSPWLVGGVSFVASSACVQLYGQGVNGLHWPWQIVSAGLVALVVLMAAFGLSAGRRAGWTDRQSFGIAAGALLTYCWSGFFSEIALHGPAMLGAHALLAAAMVLLMVLAALRLRAI